MQSRSKTGSLACETSVPSKSVLMSRIFEGMQKRELRNGFRLRNSSSTIMLKGHEQEKERT